MRLGWLGVAWIVLTTAGPLGAETSYVQNRADYAAFRERFPELLEPNYLPFMSHWVERPALGLVDALRRRLPLWAGGVHGDPLMIFCHWSAGELPIPVHVTPPEIPEDEDLLSARTPESYVAAVQRALAIWERDLEGRVGFRAVPLAEARLVVHLVGEEAPVEDPDVQVLGTAPVGGSCRVAGWSQGTDRLEVEYRIEELHVYVADQHGLLLPDQVEKVALHEIGHALGMPDHSPVPADLMYRVARDRIGRDGLGAEDVNSFLSLYALPNGTIYKDPTLPPNGVALPPTGPPRLALAPHVDARLGFEIQPPFGWQRIETPYGFVAVDGVTWDYEASFQIVVRRYDTLEEYLDRYGPGHLGTSRVRSVRDERVAGRRAKRILLETERQSAEELVFIESGDGRVVIVIAECPLEGQPAYRPWFEASLASLEIADAVHSDADRDYGDGVSEPAAP